MLEVQHLLPVNHPLPIAFMPEGFMEFAATLKGVDSPEGAIVPDTALSIYLAIMINGTTIEIRKNGKLSLINLCCFERQYEKSLMKVVSSLYRQHRLGSPKQPAKEKWVHSIPVNRSLDNDERQLSYWLAISFYWAVYGQITRRKN